MSSFVDVNEDYVVVKECPIAGGSLPINSEIHLRHGCIYYNGGLVDTFYQRELLGLLEKERKRPYYLRRVSKTY